MQNTKINRYETLILMWEQCGNWLNLHEFFQLQDWKILERMIKNVCGLKQIYIIFKNGMAILPSDKLLICSFRW